MTEIYLHVESHSDGFFFFNQLIKNQENKTKHEVQSISVLFVFLTDYIYILFKKFMVARITSTW